MNWELDYLPEARKDIKDLDRSKQVLVDKAIKKVKKNPLPTESLSEASMEQT